MTTPDNPPSPSLSLPMENSLCFFLQILTHKRKQDSQDSLHWLTWMTYKTALWDWLHWLTYLTDLLDLVLKDINIEWGKKRDSKKTINNYKKYFIAKYNNNNIMDYHRLSGLLEIARDCWRWLEIGISTTWFLMDKLTNGQTFYFLIRHSGQDPILG